MKRLDGFAVRVESVYWRVPVWALAVLLGLATLAVYYPAMRNGFVDFDDRDYLTQNEQVQAGVILWLLPK